MQTKINGRQLLAVAIVAGLFIAIGKAQDYDAEAETSISGLGGLTGLSGLSALANGVVAGYSPEGAGSEIQGETDGGDSADSSDVGDRGSEASEGESADYDEDSNDSSASEEHPILSKFINLISGGRHKRSVEQTEAPIALNRVKRHYKGWVPYVKTYVKTDKKAHFKWGVKAKVGKKYGK